MNNKRVNNAKTGVDRPDIQARVMARHRQPFALLGLPPAPGSGCLTITRFQADADEVAIVVKNQPNDNTKTLKKLTKLDDAALFVTQLARKKPFHYQLRVSKNAKQSLYSFMRFGETGTEPVLVICNFTAQVHHNFVLGVPLAGFYQEILNADNYIYGGSNQGNMGGVNSGPNTNIINPIPPSSKHTALTSQCHH